MWQFIQQVNKKYALSIDGYPGLYQWSVDSVSSFWEEVWDFVGIVASKKADKVGWSFSRHGHRQFFRSCCF